RIDRMDHQLQQLPCLGLKLQRLGIAHRLLQANTQRRCRGYPESAVGGSRANCRRARVASRAMATTNRDRRRAKQKARDQRRRSEPSDRLTAYQEALAAVAQLSRPGDALFPHQLAALVAGGRLVDRALPHALQDAIGYVFAGGWQPVDLVRVARREHGDPEVAVIVDTIAGRMREYPASTVDPRWAAQLGAVGADVWWASDADWVGAWAARHGVERALAIEVAIATLRLLRGLRKLPVLIPPPGEARAGEDPRPRGTARPAPPQCSARPAPAPRPAAEASARMLDRIRALLAKAE